MSEQTNAPKEKKQPAKKAVAPVAPKIVYRDQVQVDHHLFKAQVAQAIKKDIWSPIKMKGIEHVHFFHSVNSHGQVQKWTNDVCGHRHEITWGTDDEGNLIAKCGPPLKKVIRQLRNGTSKTEYVKIQMIDADSEDGSTITDSHTHEMTYEGSNKVSRAAVQAIQSSNRAEIGSMPGVIDKSGPASAEGYTVTSADRTTQE